jgi:hypothetical protein
VKNFRQLSSGVLAMLLSGQGTVRSLFSQMEGSAELEGDSTERAVFQELHDQEASWGKGSDALLGESEDSLSKSLANLDNMLQVPRNC